MRGSGAPLRQSPGPSTRKPVYPGHPVIKSYNGKSYLHYPDTQEGVRSDNMVQTEGLGQTEESVMRMRGGGTAEEKKGSEEKAGSKGLVKSASSNSSIGGIIGGNTLNEILNSA
jgi:hypothetical protein